MLPPHATHVKNVNVSREPYEIVAVVTTVIVAQP